jgi:hypothetical protein
MEHMQVTGPQPALHSNLLLFAIIHYLHQLHAPLTLALARSGENYTCNPCDEDHLASIIELLDKIARRTTMSGLHSRQFFNRKSDLRHETVGIVSTEKYE